MLTYGLFDGVARRDHLVVAAVLGLDDYKEIYGKGTEDYLDYLIELEDALLTVDPPAKVVRVPFHREMYRKWLEGSSWRDGPEARSAWALEVVQNAELFERLRAERPVLPRAPEEEREVIETLYLPCPLVCEEEADVQRLAHQLDPEVLAKFHGSILKHMPAVPPYRKLSKLRAQGVALMLGDRLIEPINAYEVEDHFDSAFLGDISTAIVKVPRHFRIKPPELEIEVYPVLVAVLLPVVLRGAEEDVEFLGEWLEGEFGPESVLVKEAREFLRAAGWHGEKAGPPGPILTARQVPHYLEALFEDEEEEPPDDPGRRGRTLKRVK
ncbi:hypothetical protein SAMN00808754_1760 [Thermanaeromonas toyohensis ToBE]|uniref:Uncharacterized protein n=1 Tax=Thermanaeromonas toyohensis ToBE TaxID=698762 RepID=A0A1W1VV19_9FIRM|nr:hypothetical protein [Thermanaeromonas toyohensis]SMB97113.1 hypothetical protein SAMN00808754_1760 [Thermanaeromonas toyohensis ToBE]